VARHFLLGLVFCLVAFSSEAKSAEITVAYAANLNPIMPELVRSFKRLTGYTVQTVMGASGKLYMQIKHGAPYDVFLAADTDYPGRLWREDQLTAGPPIVYAYNALVLWVKEAPRQKDVAAILFAPAVKKIAIANPKLAPYGQAALDFLKNKALLAKLESKIVYADSIAQTAMYLLKGTAEAGFITKSLVCAPEFQNKGWWQIVDAPLQPQAMVRLKSKNDLVAKAWMGFMQSDEAQTIMMQHGYLMSDESSPRQDCRR
jgi:molybdate transport system substrate-binding protein